MLITFQGINENENGRFVLTGDPVSYPEMADSITITELSVEEDVGIILKDVNMRFTLLVENGNLNINNLMNLFNNNTFVKVTSNNINGWLDYENTDIRRDSKGITTLQGTVISPILLWEKWSQRQNNNPGISVLFNAGYPDNTASYNSPTLSHYIWWSLAGNTMGNLPTDNNDIFGIDPYPVPTPDLSLTDRPRPSDADVLDNRTDKLSADDTILLSEFVNNWALVDGYRLKWDYKNGKYIWSSVLFGDGSNVQYLDTNLLNAEQSYKPIMNGTYYQGFRIYFDSGYETATSDSIWREVRWDLNQTALSQTDFGFLAYGVTSGPIGRCGEITSQPGAEKRTGWIHNLYSLIPRQLDETNVEYLKTTYWLHVGDTFNPQSPLNSADLSEWDPTAGLVTNDKLIQDAAVRGQNTYQLSGNQCVCKMKYAGGAAGELEYNGTTAGGVWRIYFIQMTDLDGDIPADQWGGTSKNICHLEWNPGNDEWSFVIDTAVNDTASDRLNRIWTSLQQHQWLKDDSGNFYLSNKPRLLWTTEQHTPNAYSDRTLKSVSLGFSYTNDNGGSIMPGDWLAIYGVYFIYYSREIGASNPFIYEYNVSANKTPYEIHTQKPLWQLYTNTATDTWTPSDDPVITDLTALVYNKKAVISVSTKEELDSEGLYSIYTGLENQYTVPYAVMGRLTRKPSVPAKEHDYEFIAIDLPT